MKKNRVRIFLAVFVAVVCVSLCTAAALKTVFPSSADGSFGNRIVNRVAVSLSPTKCVYSSKEAGEFVFDTVLKAKKNEPDFYAVLHSLSVSGLEYDRIVITPLRDEGTTESFPDVLMSGDEYSWNVKIYFSADAEIDDPAVNIVYTAGVKYESAVKRIMKIPLEIEITE